MRASIAFLLGVNVMKCIQRHGLVWAFLFATAVASSRGDDNTTPHGYPDPLPDDVSFDTVVKSQSFPFMKYVVNVFGAKVHPEEFHLTASGELIAPYTPDWKGLCIAPMIGTQPADDTSLDLPTTALLPADGVISRLVDGYLPAIENQWKVGDLEIRQLAFATSGGKFESTTGKEPLIAMVRYTVTNKSNTTQTVAFTLHFGEANNALSVKAIPPAYPHKITFNMPFFRQDDGVCVACLLTKDQSAASPPGAGLLVAGALAAGESKVIEIAVPYFPLSEQDRARLESLKFDDELAAFRKFWTAELNRNAEFVVPESRIRDAYRTCLASNMVLTDRDPASGVLMPHPDALGYESVWAGDSGVIIQAMDRLGCHKEAESMLDYFLARQGKDKPEGDVTSAEGFFSGDVDLKWMNQNGFVLWALAEHYKLTHDDAWLKRVAPQMIKGCDWIARERARTKVQENGEKVKHFGLLPKGRPSDLYIWDNWYWTDTYSYMGVRWTADVLAAIGMKDEAARLATEADDYKACILDSIERSIDKNIKPPFLPPTPYRVGPPTFDFFNENWYTISNPLYMVEAGLLDAKDERVGGSAGWVEKNGMYSGLPAFMNGSIDPYYVYNQSLTQLLRGESDKFAWTFYSIPAYAMGQGTYATIEGQNILTGFNSEVWSASRQPHMHSNSRFLDLVRIALVLEEGDTLHLMTGTPRGWLADGQTIEVKRSPSYFGEVDFTAHSELAKGQITISIEPPQWQPPKVVIHVRPPMRYGNIKAVQVNGKEWKEFDRETVRLPRLDKKTAVRCLFSLDGL
jgi:hypothetical protein